MTIPTIVQRDNLARIAKQNINKSFKSELQTYHDLFSMCVPDIA